MTNNINKIKRLSKNNAGLASAEAILFSVFFLFPLLILSIAVVQRTSTMQNSIASVRHGGFRKSMEGARHYEDRVGLSRGKYDAEREVKRNIAYSPPSSGKILGDTPPSGSPASTVPEGTVRTVATVRVSTYDLNYTRQLNSRVLINRRTEIARELIVPLRSPSLKGGTWGFLNGFQKGKFNLLPHYDNGAGPAHQFAKAQQMGFLGLIAGLHTSSLSGPMRSLP